MTTDELSAEQVIQKIGEFKGNLSMVARYFKLSRQTLYNYLKKRPTVQAALDEARETMIDNVESALYSAALAGESWAVCFFLKTQGKSRGYIERQEVTGKDGGPQEHKNVVEIRGVDYRTVATKLAPRSVQDSDSSSQNEDFGDGS